MAKNDVYRYQPSRERHDPNWCREGMAIETDTGKVIDTYWDLSARDVMVDHYLTGEELAGAELVANLDDFEPFYRNSTHYNSAGYDGYAESDRLTITSQHGLTQHRFIRKGATPSPDRILAKLRADISAALYKRDSAMREVESARAILRHVETGRWPWEEEA